MTCEQNGALDHLMSGAHDTPLSTANDFMLRFSNQAVPLLDALSPEELDALPISDRVLDSLRYGEVDMTVLEMSQIAHALGRHMFTPVLTTLPMPRRDKWEAWFMELIHQLQELSKGEPK